MANFKDKSILKTEEIKKVLLNKKEYNFQDFHFKFINPNPKTFWEDTFIEVYDFDVLICKFKYIELDGVKFNVKLNYFNPQTNNDCQSINHIIRVFSELCSNPSEDRGNCDVINNQYIFRKRRNYYSFTKIWTRGEILDDNYDKDLSYEFSTEEYINYLKKIFNFKRMPRRDLKKRIKNLIEKAIEHENKRLLVENLEDKNEE